MQIAPNGPYCYLIIRITITMHINWSVSKYRYWYFSLGWYDSFHALSKGSLVVLSEISIWLSLGGRWRYYQYQNSSVSIIWPLGGCLLGTICPLHDDVIKWKHFPRYWPPVNSPYKGQWRGALMFTLICARINGWVNNCKAGDLRRHRGHYDVGVMFYTCLLTKASDVELWCLLWSAPE